MQRALNQIRANSYFHIFAFVEEYIVPMVLDHARRDVFGDEVRLRFLLRFAEEETKHQAMLRRAMTQFESGFAAPCGVIPGREGVARVVLGKSPLSASRSSTTSSTSATRTSWIRSSARS